MTVFIGCDRGALELKNALIPRIKQNGYAVEDLGAFGTEPSDYTDYALSTAQRVAATPDSFGVVLCRTGIGMSIAANKVRGIRCALCVSPLMARLTREHNNANMLALGADIVSFEVAIDTALTFLTTPFSGEERHARRVNKIIEYENLTK